MSAELERRVRALESQIAGLRSAGRPRYVFETYTPTYRGTGTAGTVTYSQQIGRYARLNAVAIVWGRIAWTNVTGTPTGNGIITLPFALRSVTNLVIAATLSADGLDFTGAYVSGSVDTATVSVSGVNVGYITCLAHAATTNNATAIGVVTAADVKFTVVMPIEDTA